MPFLPSLLVSRLAHQPLAWTKARVSRAASTSTVKVPAGSFPVSVYEVEIAATASASRSGAAPGGVAPGGAATGAASQAGSRKLTFAVEAQPPFRLIRQTGGSGEQLLLLGSTRLSYWQLNQPGGEKYLEELGLKPQATP